MNDSQFQKLSNDLRSLARIIPLHWGAVQNNRFDSNINMFEIDSFEQLEAAIRDLTPELKNYFRRRWYLWKCAQCDEYLFNLSYNDKELAKLIQEAFKQFIHSEVTFLYQLKKIAIGSKEAIIATSSSIDDIKFLEEEDYFAF